MLRYDACDDDIFEPHFDVTTTVCGRTSLLTVLIYLNDGDGTDFGGGETHFIDHVNSKGAGSHALTTIAPRSGKVVVFKHNLFHSLAPLTFGTKYVLRTDVLFERKGDVDGPRTGSRNGRGSGMEGTSSITLLDVCQRLPLSESEQRSLDEIGLLDLTLDSLLAPGVLVVCEVLRDVLNENSAKSLIEAALEHR